MLVGSDTMFCPFNSFYNSHLNFMVPIFENVAILFFFTHLVFFRPIALFLQSADDVIHKIYLLWPSLLSQVLTIGPIEPNVVGDTHSVRHILIMRMTETRNVHPMLFISC